MLYVTYFPLRVSGTIAYNHQTLLDIRLEVPNSWKLDLPKEIAYNKQCCWGQGKWGSILVTLQPRPIWHPIPSILLAKVQPLDSKLDKHQCQISSQRDMKDYCNFCCIETWLGLKTPDRVIQPEGFSVYHMDRLPLARWMEVVYASLLTIHGALTWK